MKFFDDFFVSPCDNNVKTFALNIFFSGRQKRWEIKAKAIHSS